MNNKIAEVSSLIANQLYYKLPYKCGIDLHLILLQQANIDCYTSKELQKYKDIVQSLIYGCTISASEITIDNTNREQWDINNPGCTSRKQWEKIAYKICDQYRLEFIIEDINKTCDIAFDITRNIIDCEVLTSISIQQKLCSLDITVDKQADKCSAEYKLLIEKYPTCNISKREYIYLLDNSYSFEIISSIYDKSLQLEVDPYGNTHLVSPLSKYQIDKDLKFKEIIVDSNSKDLVFTNKILEDYNINNIKKQQLLNEINFI